MDTLIIPERPRHGIVTVEVPAGSGWRAATVGSKPVPSQFIPAPYEGAGTEGRLLVQVPEGAGEISLAGGTAAAPGAGSGFARLEDGALTLTLGGISLELTDEVNNGAVSAAGLRSIGFNGAFEAQAGVYPVFTAAAKVTTVGSGPLAEVARVAAPLTEKETGQALYGAVAYYDFIRYLNAPLLEMTACFTAGQYAPVRSISFGQLVLPKVFDRWEGGNPLFAGDFADAATDFIAHEVDGYRPRSFRHYGAVLGDAMSLAYVGGHPLIQADSKTITLAPVAGAMRLSCRDIREYDAHHPFSAHLVYGEGPGLDAAAWVGQLPPVLKAPACRCGATVLQAGALSVAIENKGCGADIVGIGDGGTALLASAGNQLFTVLLREVDGDAQYLIGAGEGWGRVSILEGKNQATLLFDDPKEPALCGLSVLMTATMDPARDAIAWDMDIRNASRTVSVVRADYARLPYEATAETSSFVSIGPGQVIEGTRDMDNHQFFPYPSIVGCMQYMALWDTQTNRGLYYGIHDPEGCYKEFLSEKSAYSRRGFLTAIVPAEGIGEPANSFKLPGQAVWQAFSGGWYDATMIYRDWALNNAIWIPEITEEGRMDMAQWMKTVPFWFRAWVDEEGNWISEALEAQKDLDVPSAYHVYQWHEIPFDNDYPHYDPAKPDALEGFKKLQAAGIKVMPYINGRLWDTKDRGMEDWQFSAVAKPHATKDRFGRVITESYVSREEDGERVQLAVMCPSTALWQEKQKEINNWLLNIIGVDAVYIDQIAAAPPVLCMDKTHAHRPGGGAWWNYAYYNLLDHLRLMTPPDGGYTTEANGETYMRKVDTYLTWHWTQDGQVPAYSAVYAAYAPMFGRNYSACQRGDPTGFRILAGQSLLYGEQIGWVTPHDYLNSPYRSLYKKIVRTRWACNDFFYAGFMQRPPVITGDVPTMTTVNIMGGTEVINTPAVLGAVWKRIRDNKRILLLVNMDDDARAVNVALEGGGTAKLTGDMDGTVSFAGGSAELTLPAVSVVVAELED